MIAAYILLGIAIYGFYLTEIWRPDYAPSDNPDFAFYRMIGWALIAFVIWKWRVIWEGAKSTGKILAFFLLVAILAAVFGGQTKLWTAFF